jgi:UDPglucose 6-dehydrogenase
VGESKILTVNVWSSELAKLVANAMLAQRISSINTISAICDQTGADIDEVAIAIGCDNRLGSKFLKAGVGFGGSCFKKDILSLVYLARSLHLPEVADYWMSVLEINEFQRSRFMRRVVSKLNGALVGKKITVLGYTFKQDTNDTRESPAIDVIKAILSERPAEIAIFDPGCTQLEIKENISTLASNVDPHVLKPHGPVQVYSNAYDACSDSSAVLILTPWKQFRYPQPAGETGIISVEKSSILSNLSGLTIQNSFSEIDLLTIEASSRERLDSDVLDDVSYGDDPLCRTMPQPPCPSGCELCAEHNQPKSVKATENVDWAQVASTMRGSRWIFDGRNIVDGKRMARLGFRVESLGKGRTMWASRNCSAAYY